MSNQIIQPQDHFTQLSWYKPLIEEISDTIKIAVIESRTRLVEGHWEVGKLLRTISGDIDITKLVQCVAVDLAKYIKQISPESPGISERTLWYCLKAYDKYPEFGKIPEGNNISWSKLISKYLTDPSDKEIHEVLLECPNCKFKDLPEKFRKI